MALKPTQSPVFDTRGPVRLSEAHTSETTDLAELHLAAPEGDIFTSAPTNVSPPKAAPLTMLGKVEEAGGAMTMSYRFAGIPVLVTVREADARHPYGVMMQVGDGTPHRASPVELLTINELAQRSMDALGTDPSPEAVIQRDRLEATILLVGVEARAQFDVGPKSPARDVFQSDMASALVVLKRPKNIDEAFDNLVATAKGTALVRRHTDNVMAWNMKWDLVTKPRKSFAFSYFSIERDAYGYAYMGALLALRLRDIPVRGITDFASNSSGHGFSAPGLGLDYMQELAQYGADISLYDTPFTRLKSLAKHGVGFGVLASDHDKLAIADAGTDRAEGETGGRNVAGAYHQDPKDNPKSWRDDSVQIRGKEVTNGLLAALDRELASPGVRKVKPDRFNGRPKATEMLAAAQLMEAWIRSAPLNDADKAAVRADPAKRQALADQLVSDAMARLRAMPGIPDSIRGQALTSGQIKHVNAWALELANDLELRGSRAEYDTLDDYQSAEVKVLDQVGAASAAPGERFNEIGPDLLQLITGAQRHIIVQNPYVVLTEPMMAAFEDAASRGVKIDIITNSPESTDSAITQGFFLNDWKGFLARVPTARVMVATGERKFHAKAFVIDGKISADTSYNADLISGLVNGEIGAVTRSEPFAKNLIDAIQADLDDPANKFKEWSIKRDSTGAPIRGADGQPLAAWGPDQDISPKLIKRYRSVQLMVSLATRTSLLSSLRHPSKG